MVIILTSAAITSCSKDDDDVLTTGSIVGTWVNTDTSTENGLTETITTTYNFTSSGTGYVKLEYINSSGSQQSLMYPFHYTVTTATDGTMTVKIVYDDDNTTYTFTCTQTGNTLMIGSSPYIRK